MTGLTVTLQDAQIVFRSRTGARLLPKLLRPGRDLFLYGVGTGNGAGKASAALLLLLRGSPPSEEDALETASDGQCAA